MTIIKGGVSLWSLIQVQIPDWNMRLLLFRKSESETSSLLG